MANLDIRKQEVMIDSTNKTKKQPHLQVLSVIEDKHRPYLLHEQDFVSNFKF